MALSKDRSTPYRKGDDVGHPVKAGALLYAGALVVLDGGYAAPGHEATGLIAVGRSEQPYDNRGGQDGDLTAAIRTGVLRFANDAAAPVERSHIGSLCYVVDDERVSASDGGGTRSVAGRIFDLEDAGVWIDVGPVG